MSYLLDALNKSRGDGKQPSGPYEHQPMSYPPQSFGGQSQGGNIYKWISIVLALLLTLIAGVFLGNRFSLFSPPQQVANPPVATTAAKSPTSPAVVTENPVVVENTAKIEANINDAAAQQNVAQTPAKAENKAKFKPSNKQQKQSASSAQANDEQPADGEETFNTAELAGIDSELLQRFNQAVKQTANSEDATPIPKTEIKVEEYLTKVPLLSELDYEQQQRMPDLVYETHLYASDPKKRQVKLNGVTLNEKDWIADDIQIFEIQRQFLIFEMGHLRFSLPALTDWQAVSQDD